MAEDIADIGFRVDTKDLDRAANRLDKLPGKAKKTEKATDRLKRSFGGLATRAGAANKAMSLMAVGAARLGRAMGAALVLIGSALSFRKFIQGTTEADRVQSQLAASIKSTGGAAGQSVKALNANATALQKVTKFGDETINTAQGILLSFTKIQGDTFPKATEAVLNVATALQTDLKSAAIQVGKALNDPILGMTALSRSGITFSQVQKDLVKDMVSTGDIVGAQTLILKELETQFGGSAIAARQNLGGALTGLKNAFGDLFELGASASEPLRQAIEKLIVAISSPAFMAFFHLFGSLLFGALQAVIGILTGVANGISFVASNTDILMVALIALLPLMIANFGPSALAMMGRIVVIIGKGMVGAVRLLTLTMLKNPIGLMAVAIAAVVGWLTVFRDEIAPIKGELASLGDFGRVLWEMMINGLQRIGEFFSTTFTNISNIVNKTFARIAEIAGTAFSSVNDNVASVKTFIKGIVNDIIGLWFGAFKSIGVIWEKFPAVVGEAAIGAVNAVIRSINDLIAGAIKGVDRLIRALNNVKGININEVGKGTGGIDEIDNPFTGATNGLVSGVRGAFAENADTDFLGAASNAVTNLLRSGGSLATFGENLRTRANEIAALRLGVDGMQTGFEAVKPSIDATNKSLGETGAAAGGAAGKVSELAKATLDAAKKTADFTKGLVGGAISDFRSALEDGKVTVQEWGNIFLSVLDKITDRLLNQVLDALFEVNTAGSGGSGGGSGGNLIGQLIGSIFGGANAKGNAFDNGSRVKKFGSGGVVSSTTSFGMSGGQTGMMGEAGPEGILPLTRTRGGDLGVKQVGGGDGVVVQIVDQRGADAPPVRQERSTTGDGRELRRFIIGAVKEATASGELDGVQGGRFGAQPVKVFR